MAYRNIFVANTSRLYTKNKMSVVNAVEKSVSSFSECLRTGESKLDLPELISIEYRNYE